MNNLMSTHEKRIALEKGVQTLKKPGKHAVTFAKSKERREYDSF